MTIIFTCITVKTVAVDPPESTTVKVPESSETEGNTAVFLFIHFAFNRVNICTIVNYIPIVPNHNIKGKMIT